MLKISTQTRNVYLNQIFAGYSSFEAHQARFFDKCDKISFGKAVGTILRTVKEEEEDSHGDPAYQKKWFKAKRVAREKGHPKSSPKEQRAPAQRARFIGSNQVSYKHCP
ncbi:hypothetical protein AVEN_111972-1 [Araneus ventricosus]|uniref:Uncharacterized protein n=1 Tax=Araneus ventricosus TaxID=182803 RepID=A0A4Y2QC61_ARAVE|nr:hypothetical protein AVEN_111972-1 [Araneus ventricosus]